ncbi:unnamed protein product [Sphenostylis stenocarpa]|uniref:Uncharacterized protein n=1 Tax=Sphenostylis stenocarpa TaxID=92480 RepID=A0AA86SZS0_9FABA|nr:unnamed protein product [Sphenostylis stenocarpa]
MMAYKLTVINKKRRIRFHFDINDDHGPLEARTDSQWSRAVHAVVTGCTANFTCSQLIEVTGLILSSVGSSPAAINFGVTLVGTFVFGILSEEHPRFEAVS